MAMSTVNRRRIPLPIEMGGTLRRFLWLLRDPESWDLETVEAALRALCAEPWPPRGVGVGTRRRLQRVGGFPAAG